MTEGERLRAPSGFECCMCAHGLSVRELEEFYGKVDEQLCGEAYCSSCTREYLQLCRECSARYTVGEGLCSECATTTYGLVVSHVANDFSARH
jgi:hypothetical protein